MKKLSLQRNFTAEPEDKTYYVPDDVQQHMNKTIEKGNKSEEEWNEKYNKI